MPVKGCNTIVKPLKIKKYVSILIVRCLKKSINFGACFPSIISKICG